MTVRLAIKHGDLFRFPWGLYEFQKEWPHNKLHFIRLDTKLDLPIPEEKFERMLGEGKAVKVEPFKELRERELESMLGDGTAAKVAPFELRPDDPEAAVPPGEFGPDEENSKDAVRARTLQFYVRKFDELRPKKSDKALQRFINEWRPIAAMQGLKHIVRPGRLRHAINHRGVPGNRPARMFRSMRGKGRRRRLNPVVHLKLDEAALFFWEERRHTYKAAWDRFVVLLAEENRRREARGDKPLDLPRRAETLRRRINAAECHATWEMKYSKREADLRFRGIKQGLKATRPLELVIMDHTVADNWVVFDSEARLPLGRPTLTVAIDVCTRMVLGYLISFEPASLYSVLTTLKRVNRNKHYVQKLYPEIKRKWDGWGRPETIVVDQAWEFKSPSFQDALADLGTEVLWAPVRTPQYKAIGERFFKTLNLKLFHVAPGAVPHDPKTMRTLGLDPAKDALFTLAELDEAFHAAIEDYHYDMHTGIHAVPAQVWRDKLREGGRHFIPNINALDDILGRVHDGTLTRRGIRFKNMEFHDEPITGRLLEDLVAFERKRRQSDKPLSSARVDVKFKWNPADAVSISVWNRAAEPPCYERLPNRDEIYADGLSYWHQSQILKFAKEQGLAMSTEFDRCEARDRLRRKWEKLIGAKLAMRPKRAAIRGLTPSQDDFEDRIKREEDAPDGEVRGPDASDVAAPSLVPDVLPASERKDGGERPLGKAPTKAALRAAARTRKERRREEAEEKKERLRNTGERHKREGSGIKPGRSGIGTATPFERPVGETLQQFLARVGSKHQPKKDQPK